MFTLGAVVVIDTALLLVLREGRNRRRITTALVVLVAGAWLYHAGIFGYALLAEGSWPVALRRFWIGLVVTGGLLMPSALLHWLVRLYRTGLTVTPGRQVAYGLPYLPAVAVPFVLATADVTPPNITLILAPYALPYAIWVALVNLAAVVGLFLLRRREDLGAARHLFGLMSGTLLAITVLNVVVVSAPAAAWAPFLRLAAMVAPVLICLLFGFFIVRFNFLQVVLGRTMVYGGVLVGMVLFYRIFLLEIWESLSERFQVDFAIVTFIAALGILLLFDPVRDRAAEALRYLLGERMSTLRARSQQLALEMSHRLFDPPELLLTWFCEATRELLGVEYVAAWQLDDTEIKARGGGHDRLGDERVEELVRDLVERGMSLCTRQFWQTALAERALVDGDAALIIRLDHPTVAGLFLFGRLPRSRELSEEQVTAGRMLVEQLGITLSHGQLQAERLAAERRLLHRDRLSTLGLVTSSIAHEVRNPLSSIKTITTLMAEQLGEDHEHAEDLALVRAEVDRLAKTTDELLSFARPVSGQVQPVDIAETVEGAMRLMRHFAKKRGVGLIADLAPGIAAVEADANGLREILLNLLRNAVEAAEQRSDGPGEVWIRANDRDSALELTVSDDGPGIPPELVATLFEPFVTSKDDGTGLGLYNARRRAEEIGATLTYDSEPGGGCTFTLRLERGG